jgi:hypothetical protein
MDSKSYRTDALRKLFLLPFVSITAAFNSCSPLSSDYPNVQSIQSISVTNRPSPYLLNRINTTTVTVSKDTITYEEDTTLMTAVRDSNGNVTHFKSGPDSLVLSWSKPIIDSDFVSVASFIIGSCLIGMPDQTGLIGCGGYFLIIQLRDRADTISVFGCNLPQTERLSNLNEVSSRLNALEVKYGKL